MKRPSTNQRGQAMVFTLVFLIVLLGMAAAVLDVGAWYRADRQTAGDADASALAGAQELPDSTAAPARQGTLEYARQERGRRGRGRHRVLDSVMPTDTIKVTARKPSPGVFTRLFGIDSVTIARARRRGPAMTSAKWAAPIGVDYRHPMLGCEGPPPDYPCSPTFNKPTEIDFEKVGPGAFRLINIDGSHGGTGPGRLGDWIRTASTATWTSTSGTTRTRDEA